MPVEFARFTTDIGIRHTRWVVLAVESGEQGWLLFAATTSHERRRLRPVPPDWITLDETALIHLLDQADRIDPPSSPLADIDPSVAELHTLVKLLDELAAMMKVRR